MKLKKGSLEAKRFMAKIRAMKAGTKKKSIGATKFVEKNEPKNTKPKRTIQITRKANGTFKKFKQIGGIYDTIKSKVNRATTSTKKNIAYSVIDSAIKSANSKEKLALKKAKATIKNTYLGATKFVEKNEPKNTKPKRTIQITRKANGTFKKFKSLGDIHKDTKSHNVKINVLSGLNNQVLIDLQYWIKKLSQFNEELIKYQKEYINKDNSKSAKAFYKKMIMATKKQIALSKNSIKNLKSLL
jgi:hypothetical protein